MGERDRLSPAYRERLQPEWIAPLLATPTFRAKGDCSSPMGGAMPCVAADVQRTASNYASVKSTPRYAIHLPSYSAACPAVALSPRFALNMRRLPPALQGCRLAPELGSSAALRL
jgi:hypothetical protein